MGLFRVRDRGGGVEIRDDLRLNYPDTPLAELAQKHKADYYFARGNFELAEEEYAALARDYPRSRYHPYALLQSARAALASFPGVHYDDVGLIEAQERFSQFLSMYPEAGREHGVPVMLEQIAARRADKTYEIAWFYHRTRQPAAARYYYRATIARWPGTPAAAQSQSRLAELGEPESMTEGQTGREDIARVPNSAFQVPIQGQALPVNRESGIGNRQSRPEEVDS
jgi:outer membrane protein assembly factor BamD (BamD/ComL family)